MGLIVLNVIQTLKVYVQYTHTCTCTHHTHTHTPHTHTHHTHNTQHTHNTTHTHHTKQKKLDITFVNHAIGSQRHLALGEGIFLI